MKKDNINKVDIISKINHLKDKDSVVAALDKDALKLFFKMFTSKSDSLVHAIYNPITITHEDIIELNQMIMKKLKLHNVDVVTTTIILSFKGCEALEFGTWESFSNHEFTEDKAIDYISISWDILLCVEGSTTPLPHKLLVKISSGLKPFELLQTLFSGDTESINLLEENTAPCVIRVDFINGVISEELVNIVKKWNHGRRKIIVNSKLSQFFAIQHEIILPIFRYLFPLLGLILSCGILHKFGTFFNDKITNFGYWFLIVISSQVVLLKIGEKISKALYINIAQFKKLPVFQLTRGDKKLSDIIEQKNIKARNSILKIVFLNFFIGLCSSLIATYLFNIFSNGS